MTDRELLELAAKAAGLELGDVSQDGQRSFLRNGIYWQPFDDDGDALRLAVKLELELDLLTGDKRATTVFYETEAGGSWKVHEPHRTDPYAATRRAIVRAAAAIGKAL